MSRAARLLITACAPALALAPVVPARAADAVERPVLDAFNNVVRRVGDSAETDPERAIELYEQALLDGPTRGFGRLHLRIAHLHRTAGRFAEAAYHFQSCIADERVDPIDRQFICERGLEQVTAPLTIEGLPEGGTVQIIEPATFAGLHQSGARVPRGEVQVVVEAPGRLPERSTIAIDGPTLWTARIGLEEPTGPLVPDDFVESPVEPVEPDGLPRWPGYVAGGVGVLLVGGGLAVGLQNRDALGEIRDRQSDGRCGADRCAGDLSSAEGTAGLADAMWIGGAVLAAGGVVWWLVSGDRPVIGGTF